MEMPVSGSSILTSDDQALVLVQPPLTARVASCSSSSASSTRLAIALPVKPCATSGAGLSKESSTTLFDRAASHTMTPTPAQMTPATSVMKTWKLMRKWSEKRLRLAASVDSWRSSSRWWTWMRTSSVDARTSTRCSLR